MTTFTELTLRNAAILISQRDDLHKMLDTLCDFWKQREADSDRMDVKLSVKDRDSITGGYRSVYLALTELHMDVIMKDLSDQIKGINARLSGMGVSVDDSS